MIGILITGVQSGSPAERLGIRPGWRLERIGDHQIEDVLDYRFRAAEKNLTLRLCDQSGASATLSVQKGEYQDLGLEFASYLMDKQKSCRNNCVFCFIDQLPPGMRESLYFKDDDERLSFLFGNYVTLTNLRGRDVERIIEMRISPVNVSVHTTDPELRVKMMGNPDAGKVLGWLPRLAEGGISLNAQLVLCPGLNDGIHLERSLRDLAALMPSIQSVAIVPVGLTKHRQGLAELRPFTGAEAAATLDALIAFGDEMLAKHGRRVFYASDEFYLLAGREFPPESFYGDFDQLENGVGMSALFASEFADALERTPPNATPRRVSIATGVAAAPLIRKLMGQAREQFPETRAEVFPIVNNFFGEGVTVSGLVTGRDIIAQLTGKDLGEALLIPRSMLRHEGDMLLDDLTPQNIAQALGLPVRPVEIDGGELLDALLGKVKDAHSGDARHLPLGGRLP